MITCRLMEEQDIDEVVELGREMHSQSGYSAMEFDPEVCRQMAREVVRDELGTETAFVVVDEDTGLVVGLLAASVGPAYFARGLVATDYLVYVTPEWRSSDALGLLLGAYVDWAEEMDVDRLTLVTSAEMVDDRILGRVYASKGFARVGSVYQYRRQ
jgi:GNAT superfamily N-acetyltransferase